MPSVNGDVLQMAGKNLSFITLTLIEVFNVFLAYAIVRTSGGPSYFLKSPRLVRSTTLLLLIVGDFFAGFCSRVVKVQSLFSLSDDSIRQGPAVSVESMDYHILMPNCRAVNVGRIYLIFMLPFVYSMGLVILACEAIAFRRRLRLNRSPENPKLLLCLLVSAAPWVLGIVAVIPLALVDVGFESCPDGHNISRIRTLIWVCHIMPVTTSTAVTLASVVLMSSVSKYSGPDQTFQDPPICSTPAFKDQASPPTASQGTGNQESDLNGAHTQQTSITDMRLNRHFSSTLTSSETTERSKSKAQSISQPTFPPRNYFMKNERVALLLVNLVLLLCILPYPIVYLEYVHGDSAPKLTAFTAVFSTEFAYWMLCSRSWMAPAMWLLSRNFL